MLAGQIVAAAALVAGVAAGTLVPAVEASAESKFFVERFMGVHSTRTSKMPVPDFS